MSGAANQIPPIPLRFDGAEEVQRTIDALLGRINGLEAAGKSAGGVMGGLRAQTEATGGAFRNTGQIIGQAGYQVQDFAVQVASGQSALTAFVQQGSQLAGVFGPAGILAGAALAVGGIAARFVDLRDVMRLVDQSFYDAQRATAAYGDATEKLTQAIENNAAAEARRRRERDASLLQETIRSRNDIGVELTRAEERLRRMDEARAANAETDRLARAAGLPQVMDAGREVPGEYDRVRADVERLREIRQSLGVQYMITTTPDLRADESMAGWDYWRDRNRYLEEEEKRREEREREARRAGSRRTPDRDPRQYGPLDGSRAGVTQLERGRIQYLEEQNRDQERLERDELRSLERREAANRRVTDSIVGYSADSFATLFDKNGRGWEGMLETFESTAKRTVARIAAEMVIRPIVEPIVSGLGLGSLGGGNGGFSGISSLFGGTIGGGGGTSSLSGLTGGPNLSSVTSAGGLLTRSGSGGGGLFGGIGGYISNPIWTPAGGWFGPSLQTSTSAVTSAANAAPWLIPADAAGAFNTLGSAANASGGIVANIGSVSAGTYAAGIGAGYGAGSMLGSYIAKTDAQRTNSQLGAGGGAAAGAVIGAAVGGPFAPITAVIGGLIGGVAGGAGGGLLGPSTSFSGGDVGVGVDGNGFLTITRAGGKKWDGGAARDQTTAQLESLNQVLRANGVTIGGMGSGTLGWQGYGGSSNVFGPTEIWGSVRNNLSSSNPTLNAALAQPWMRSFEDLSVIAPFAIRNGSLTDALASGGIRSRDDFNAASTFISQVYEPLGKATDAAQAWHDAFQAQVSTFTDAIAKAKEWGLATDSLVSAQERAIGQTLAQRNTAVHGALSSLRVDELRAAGDTAGAARLQYSIDSAGRLRQMQDFLRGTGYGDDSALFQDAVSRMTALFAVERKQLNDSLRPSSSTNDSASGRSLLEELTVGGQGGLSSARQYAAGQALLADARRSGNLDRYVSTARTVLPQARDYLGSSEQFTSLVAEMGRTVRGLGGDPAGIASFLQGQGATNDSLMRIYDIGNAQLDEFKRMRADLNRMMSVYEALIRQQKRA